MNFLRRLFSRNKPDALPTVTIDTPVVVSVKDEPILVSMDAPSGTIVVESNANTAINRDVPSGFVATKKRKPRQKKPKVYVPVVYIDVPITKPNRTKEQGNRTDNTKNTFRSKKK